MGGDVFNAFYHRYPDAHALALTAAERAAWVDLRPYMDASPVTVHAAAPLERVHRLFTAMGLRHLLVVNDAHDCVGVITRHDLAPLRVAAVAAALAARAGGSAK